MIFFFYELDFELLFYDLVNKLITVDYSSSKLNGLLCPCKIFFFYLVLN